MSSREAGSWFAYMRKHPRTQDREDLRTAVLLYLYVNGHKPKDAAELPLHLCTAEAWLPMLEASRQKAAQEPAQALESKRAAMEAMLTTYAMAAPGGLVEAQAAKPVPESVPPV